MITCTWHECHNQTNNPKFCSLSCGAKHQAATTVRKPRLVNCLVCTTEFNNMGEPTKKFCSRSCAASHNNIGKQRNLKSGAYTKEALNLLGNCLNCNSDLTNKASKYCSQQCGIDYRRNSWIKKWLAGEINGTTETGATSRQIKQWLRDTLGNKCSICGWNEIHPITGKVPVEMEHIDGDSTNNRPENLTLLCPNHHSLTATYKDW